MESIIGHGIDYNGVRGAKRTQQKLAQVPKPVNRLAIQFLRILGTFFQITSTVPFPPGSKGEAWEDGKRYSRFPLVSPFVTTFNCG